MNVIANSVSKHRLHIIEDTKCSTKTEITFLQMIIKKYDQLPLQVSLKLTLVIVQIQGCYESNSKTRGIVKPPSLLARQVHCSVFFLLCFFIIKNSFHIFFIN